ncbi:C-type lectin domain family 4 member G-like [Salarias fasciatus]|uniref:C-type lectin domain family 10 member A-like n=1 Tax=Salarias fasciatus TaxID=181472 RepID=A0A672FS94_SALFA|nr:C-type lectin domain family 4 member G-like [Salarias fasciatus]
MMAARLRKPNVSPAAEGKSAVLTTRSVLTVSVSWLGLMLIMALRVYFTYKSSETNAELTAENQDLMERLEQLRGENQDLEAEKKNLTEKLQEVEKVSNEVNISRAQWSIDQYCYGGRFCQPCQSGWENFQSQCYAVIDPERRNRRTWEEAREDCRGRNSDLVVINNDEEKRKVSDLSWNSGTDSGYWIGLRVLNGTWKWVDGTELTDSSWNEDPVEGRCVVSVQWQRWESVSCDQTMRWICEKKSLTV